MKKFISLLAAVSMTAACGISAMAADKAKGEPDVIVDGSRILFEDQNAVIVDDVTLVPARGVFKAMGCKVNWNEEKRTVTVTSSTGVRYVVITIDSDIMKICTYQNIMTINSEDYQLEVPAQIINDRTMIPLRAVSEAFAADVEWDEDKYTVNITSGPNFYTEDYVPEPTPEPEYDEEGNLIEPEDTRVSMSLSTDKVGKLEAGEEFTVYVDVDNFPKDSQYLNAIIATFEYDKNKFKYVEGSGTMIDDNNAPYAASDIGENTAYEVGTKVFFLNDSENHSRTLPGHAFKATFKSLSGENGKIILNNDYNSMVGYNSYVMFYTENDRDPDVIFNGNNLNLSNNIIEVGIN